MENSIFGQYILHGNKYCLYALLPISAQCAFLVNGSDGRKAVSELFSNAYVSTQDSGRSKNPLCHSASNGRDQSYLAKMTIVGLTVPSNAPPKLTSIVPTLPSVPVFRSLLVAASRMCLQPDSSRKAWVIYSLLRYFEREFLDNLLKFLSL